MSYANKVDFTGQTIYVGMDVHQKSWTVSIFMDLIEHKTFAQPPDVEVLVAYLRRHFPGASYKAVYEAGFCGFWIHDKLKLHGIPCLVVNPADIPTRDKERARKGDRSDSRKLARGLRNGELEGIYVPSRAMVEDRSLIRTRQAMVRKQTRCKNQIKSLLHFYGIPVPDIFRSWSRNFIRSLETLRLERESGHLAMKAHLSELIHLRQILAQLDRDILALSRTDEYRDRVQLLRSVPGISTLSAMVFLTELGDLARFTSLDKLCGYVGLTPDTHASGEKQGTGDMTRRCNPVFRSLLIECSWVAVRKDPALALAYHDFCKRTLKTKAIVKIARKVLNRIRFVLNNRCRYVSSLAA
ncbi:MAG: IS110 family transposase [Deltaproteobacteria bacterium]|nr:IS110 family transposase [Deltaproteobacteria bacterium]